MGTLSSCLGGETTMLRYLAIACLAAAAVGEPDAKAEADPALLCGGYGYGLGYGYGGLGYGYAGLRSYGYGLHGLGYGHYYGKREAEADPALLYSSYGYGLGHYGYAGLGHYGYAGLGHYGYAGYPYAAAGYASYSPSASTHIAGLAPAAVPAVAGGYAGAGRYVANSAGVVHVAKREAEAEADPALLYGAFGYSGLGHHGYAGLGHYGYAGYPYAAAGYASYSPSASTHIAGLAPAAVPAVAGGYAGAGRYVANSAGVVHVA